MPPDEIKSILERIDRKLERNSGCSVSPEEAKIHSEFIIRQGEINEQILEKLKDIKKDVEDYNDKATKSSERITILETVGNVNKDNTARTIGAGAIVIAVAQFLKDLFFHNINS